MEVDSSSPEIIPSPPKKSPPVPLKRLAEDRAHTLLLESKVFSNEHIQNLVEAEPTEIHFSGYQLGKRYVKTLKLINLSPDILNVHIVPTLTKYFQTTEFHPHRLFPGIACVLKIGFCPDEWRYFYDCIRVKYQGEDSLFIPVHAYPVIDDLHISPRIDLPVTALGQSVHHTIPLKCSCPVDFEFQVAVVQPHEAFSIQPLTGVISSSEEAQITITFRPVQYETAQIVFHLLVSQFNSKPYISTVTGTSTPFLALSVQPQPPQPHPHPPAHKCASKLKIAKAKVVRDQGDARRGFMPSVDLCTPAGVAKMLLKDISRPSHKDLKEALSGGSLAVLGGRPLKEAFFLRKVNQTQSEEEAIHIKWQTNLGSDPMSEQTKRQVLEDRKVAADELVVRKGEDKPDEVFVCNETKLLSVRVLHDAGQVPDEVPTFHFYTSISWDLRKRALRLFQQAAYTMVIRCRVDLRLAALRENLFSIKKAKSDETDDPTSPKFKIFLSTFPVFMQGEDILAYNDLAPPPLDAINADVTTQIPFFKLEVPQHYKLMGYQPVTAWEVFNSYVSTTVPDLLQSSAPRRKAELDEDEEGEREPVIMSFRAPDTLVKLYPTNPLRIFNPAPGIQAYKPDLKYLESEMEFYLCPLPRYSAADFCGANSLTTHSQRRFYCYKEELEMVMKWQNMDFRFLSFLANQSPLTSNPFPSRSIDYNTDILPLEAPAPISTLPDDLVPESDTMSVAPVVRLTPEMIRAEFLTGKALVLTLGPIPGVATRERLARRPVISTMGKKLMNRLKQLHPPDTLEPSPHNEDTE